LKPAKNRWANPAKEAFAMLDIIRKRRSVRVFKKDAVEEEKLRGICQ